MKREGRGEREAKVVYRYLGSKEGLLYALAS